jgi:O-antigen ligase
MMIAAAIFIILFFVLALRKLDWALLLLIAALPAYLVRFNVGGLPLTLLEAMILISFAVWFFREVLPNLRNWVKKRGERQSYPFSWEIILLLIISFISAGVAGFSLGALGIWKAYFFEPLLVFILIFNVFKTKKDLMKIGGAFLVSAVAVSLFAIFQKITGLYIANPFWAAADTRRVVSFFGYPNAVGLYLAPLVMIFFGWLCSLKLKNVNEQIPKKLIMILTIVISLLAIYFAHSTGALVGVIAGLAIFGLLAGKWPRVATMIIIVVAAVGVFLFLSPRATNLIDKLTLRDLSGEIRRQQWKETFKMLSGSRLLTGAGLNNYQTAIKPYHQEGIFFNSDKIANFDAAVWASSTLRTKYWQPVEIYLYPHNIFLNFWSELGLAGLLLFLWLIGKYLWMCLRLSVALGRARSPEQYLILGLLTAMIAIFVQGLVDVPYFKNDLAVMFWILLALVGALDLSYGRDRELKN